MKKLLSVFLVLTMLLCLAPTAVFAIGMQSSTTGITVNSTKVAFAGHEWWVIGDGTNGVYPQSDHITLLAANLDSDFQNVPFRRGESAEFTGSSQYSDDGRYYANNPESMEGWTTPNEYAGSTLQQKMEELAGAFPENERDVISARSLTGGGTYQNLSTDGIAGQGVANQKLWALSEAEWNTINNTEVRKYGTWWWLRSPYPYIGLGSREGDDSGSDMRDNIVLDDIVAARPALSLNLSSVLFTSAAEGGKSSATVGSNLVGASAPTGTVKFTMKDSKQTLTVNATTAQSTQTGEALSFSYSDATTGTNQYISCILTDSSGAVKYYGKLADSSSTASGNLSVPLAGVADGTYTLKIFSEQANGDLYTDFCSEPVSMKVAVTSGKGTVSEFGGTLIHEHSWSDEWQKNENHHWHECTVSGCPITDNSKKDGYAEHSGGTATCKDRAICEICNQEYGDLEPHELTHIDEKAATAIETGNTEYWHCDVCDRYFSDENSTNEIALADTVISKLAPKIIAGDGATVTQGEKKALSFTSDAAFDDFLRVEVDGVTLDEANYTVKEGSTVITLNADYVATLSVGEHTLGIVSESGTATAKFTVNKKAEETTAETTAIPTTPSNEAETEKAVKADNKTSPLTGGGNNLALWIAVLLISGGAVTLTMFASKKKRYNK